MVTTLRPQSSGMSSKPRQRCTVTAPRTLVRVCPSTSYAGLRVPCRARTALIGMVAVTRRTRERGSGGHADAREVLDRAAGAGAHDRRPVLGGVGEPAGQAGGEARDAPAQVDQAAVEAGRAVRGAYEQQSGAV